MTPELQLPKEYFKNNSITARLSRSIPSKEIQKLTLFTRINILEESRDSDQLTGMDIKSQELVLLEMVFNTYYLDGDSPWKY
jgi:hypothetical protein